MRWDRGYSAAYYMTVVDPDTWRDGERIEITGGAIKRTSSGLLQSADADCINYPKDREQWVRIYLDARQGSSSVHVPLFTGLAMAPDEETDMAKSEMTVQCYSVLKPADDVALLRGWYAPAGSIGAEVIKQLLSVCPAPVVVSGNSPSLYSSIVAEDGETRLTMAEKVLAAINWKLRIDGMGTIFIEPFKLQSVATLDPVEFDIIEPPIKIECDWYSIPNVYLAVSDDVSAIAKDESETSPLSTVNRGREIWMTETNCDYAQGETIAEYAMRKLKEAQRKVKEVSYNRRYLESVYPLDIIRLHYPKQGLDGLYIVESQSIDLGYNARTSEKVMEV